MQIENLETLSEHQRERAAEVLVEAFRQQQRVADRLVASYSVGLIIDHDSPVSASRASTT